MIMTSHFSLSSFSIPLLLITILFLSQSQTPVSESRDRHVIKFKSPGLYPEGLTYDPASQHLIVAALKQGTFHSITDAGVVETLTVSPSSTSLPYNSTILGLAIDKRRNRLLAAVNSPDSTPYLASFYLQRSSISLIFLSPLPGATSSAVANGVAVDPHGNAYVTNSGENFIWKVDVDGTATIFSESKLFNYYPVDPTSPYSYCGLNGIAYVDGKGFLLVVQSNTGKMFKVDATDGTTRSVIIPEELTVADGVAVKQDGVVAVVSMDNTWLLKSDDGWGEGVVIDKITLDREGFPTSVAIGGGGRVYVVYGYVEEGMKVISQGEKERELFRIEEVRSRRDSDGEMVWPFVMIGLGLVYFLIWRFQMGQLVRNMDKKHH